MSDKNFELPVYGVGPIYVGIIIALTIFGFFLSGMDIFKSGSIAILKMPFMILGIILILFGIYLWISSALGSNLQENIKEDKLVTTGIYAYVRNPIYSAFLFGCTGFILFMNNLFLLVFPVVYWALLAIFMKNTEEKWLYEKFGNEYLEYCDKVNRTIPWFKRK